MTKLLIARHDQVHCNINGTIAESCTCADLTGLRHYQPSIRAPDSKLTAP